MILNHLGSFFEKTNTRKLFMASYAEIFKQQKNGVFKVKEIDVSEELPEIGKMYVKELNGFTKLSIIQSRQTDTEKMCLLICMSLCDKDGNSTESPDTFGDVISMMPDRVFNKVLQATLEVNNATKEGVTEIKNS